MSDLEFTGEYVVPGKTPYTVYQEHIGRYIFAGEFIKSKLVLDVACGTGYGTEHLLTEGAKRVVGIDIAADAINYTQREFGKSAGLHFIRADATNLPFPDNYFDLIVSFETIEHLENQSEFLAECKRVLKSDSIFIGSTPNKRISSPYTEKPVNPFHVKEFYPEEFRHLLCKYFATVTLYGQGDTNQGKEKVLKTVSGVLSAIPLGMIIKNLLRKVIFGKNVDKRYKVHKLNNEAVKTSTYIIAMAEKKAGS